MNKIAKITILAVVITLVRCGGQTNDYGEITDEQAITAEEQQAIDIVFALPDVQDVLKRSEIRTFVMSNGIYHIEDSTYYYIRVMEEMETHYNTLYHFFVPANPNGEIKVLDVLEDTIISLEQWREKREKEQISK